VLAHVRWFVGANSLALCIAMMIVAGIPGVLLALHRYMISAGAIWCVVIVLCFGIAYIGSHPHPDCT